MKSYKEFNESKTDIHSICEKWGIKNYTINPDGSIDVASSVDFKIIATNSSDNTRTTTNITTNILGATLYWSEYGRLHINNGIGNFSVALTSSAPYVAELKITPNSANLTYYNILISSYTT